MCSFVAASAVYTGFRHSDFCELELGVKSSGALCKNRLTFALRACYDSGAEVGLEMILVLTERLPAARSPFEAIGWLV